MRNRRPRNKWIIGYPLFGAIQRTTGVLFSIILSRSGLHRLAMSEVQQVRLKVKA
jgi:hypothetical protein